MTKAQDALLSALEKGAEVTYKDDHYVVVTDDYDEIIWPSTFYGLFDNGLVRQVGFAYRISEDGIRQIRGEDAGVVETPSVDQAPLLEKD